MLTMIGGILVASLLGSLHCAGMCGAFLALAVAPDESARAGRGTLLAMYNLGRLISYATLGALAGLLGRSVNLGAELVGLQQAAAMIAGVVMILFGGAAMLKVLGVPIARAPMPHAWTRVIASAYGHAGRWSPAGRALIIGMLTTCLPCGWLYAFVFTAAGTADPTTGALTMGAFWLGTLPVMATLGLGVQSLFGPMRRHLPVATALLLMAVGLVTLAGRVRLMHGPEASTMQSVVCHGG